MTPEQIAVKRAEAQKRLSALATHSGTEVGNAIGGSKRPAVDDPQLRDIMRAHVLNPGNLSAGEMTGAIAREADDTVRVLANSVTGGAADKIASEMPSINVGGVAVGGGDLAQQQAQTKIAKAHLGPEKTMGAELAGSVLQGALLPGAAFSTIPRTLGTMGLLGGGNEIAKALGKDQLPEIEDVGKAAATSAIGGVLGKVVGDRLGNLIAKHVGADSKLYKQAGRVLESLNKQVDEASAAINKANVRVDSTYIKRAVDVLDKQLTTKRLTYRTGNLPYAKAAVDTLKKVADDGGNPTLRELNDVRQVIRNSVLDKNGARLDAVSPGDARLVSTIDRQIAKSISQLPSNPKAVLSGDASSAVKAWNKMNELVPKQKKTSILAGAFDNADLKSAQGKTDFDRSLQNEFMKLYNSAMGKAEFRGPERELIRELAEGGVSTKLLNRMDRAFGHGLFSIVYNTLRAVPRGAASGAAEFNARSIFEQLTAKELPRAVQGSRAGAIVGGEAAEQARELSPVELSINPSAP